MSFLFKVSACIFVGAFIFCSTVANEPLATDTPAEKLAVVEKHSIPWRAIARWRIEYEARPTDPVMKSVPVHKVMAVAAPGSFYHFAAHFPDMQPWEVDPYSQEFAVNNGLATHRWPFNRTFSEKKIGKGDPLGGTIAQDVLLVILPRWPLTDYRIPGNPTSGIQLLPELALRSGEYHFQAETDRVQGENCFILEKKGADRIWIAAEKGLCVMKREFREPHSGRLIQRVITEKVNEIGPGLWMPMEFQNQIFSIQSGTNQPPQIESKVRILNCRLNDAVSDSTFAIAHPAGTLKFDSEGEPTQILGGGEDLLANIVEFMTAYAHLPTKANPREKPCYWFFGGLVGGLGIAVLMKPRRSRTKT